MGGAAVVAVRLATIEDADTIAALQIAAWRAAYGDIVPARWLEELDVDERAARWRGRIGPAADPSAPTFVATEGDDVVGFVHVGPIRDEDLEPHGRIEVYTVYVHPDAWRRGVGRALLDEAESFGRRAGASELTLWVFERNAASRAFYERLGWRADGTAKIDDFGDAQPVEVRYRKRIG